jgi:hypothetical protein
VSASFRAAVVALLLVGSVGCVSQSFDATTLGVPASMATAPADIPEGKPFRTTTHTVHGLFGMVTLSRANLRKGLAQQLVGGTGVGQLKITTKSRWFDVLVTGLTLGLLVPRTVVYEGVIIGR